MDNTAFQNYFNPSPISYWKWGGEKYTDAIEWTSGGTLIYLADLMHILEGEIENGWFDLDVYLLVLAACKEDWWRRANSERKRSERVRESIVEVNAEISESREEQKKILREKGGNDDDIDGTFTFSIIHPEGAYAFLDTVQKLPKEFRERKGRKGILYAIKSISISRVAPEQAKEMCLQLKGDFEKLLFENLDDDISAYWALKRSIDTLNKAHEAFPTTEALLNFLQTGQEEAPEPLPDEELLPEIESEEADLLTALEHDAKTAGLARLARRIIAGVHIPREARDTSDQALGGYSDITNRGDFDKLLLSELAQEDDMLMARLANNEALYLRREGMPEQPAPQRRILLDVSLKMWGIPRIFGMACALALNEGDKRERLMDAFWLGGDREAYGVMDLSDKAGVMEALREQQASLHCGQGMQHFFNQNPHKSDIQHVFITAATNWHDPAFQAWFGQYRELFTFVMVVDRSGKLEVMHYRLGRANLIASPTFDLDLILTKRKRKDITGRLTEDIAFVKAEVPPLYFPTPQFGNGKGTGIAGHGGVAMGIDRLGRLLYWKDNHKGVIELKHKMPIGDYFWGYFMDDGIDINKFWILLYQKNEENPHSLFYASEGLVDSSDMTHEVINEDLGEIQEASFVSHQFGLIRRKRPANELLIFDVLMKEVFDSRRNASGKFQDVSWHRPSSLLPGFTSSINRSYNIFHRIADIWIDPNGDLQIGKQRLSFMAPLLKFKLDRSENLKLGAVIAEPQESMQLFDDNRRIVVKPFVWPDGSMALVDNRGLLHLKSSDPNIPEMTIVLILGKQTACWSSDGYLGGRDYFHYTGELKPNSYFREKILIPFYETIAKY
ncbi:MAG: hypothetical protein AB8F95_17390 [Bacteroidia bacterium]